MTPISKCVLVVVSALAFVVICQFAQTRLLRARMQSQGRLLNWQIFVAYLAEEKGCVFLSCCDGGRVWWYPQRDLPNEPIPYLLSTEAFLVQCPFWIRTRHQFDTEGNGQAKSRR
jgi:hypothetical protein